MKRHVYIVMAVLACCWCFSCQKEGRLDHIDTSGTAPQQISDVKTEGKPGKVIVTYKIPNDPNFMYAKAEYEIQPGVLREAKASLYTDTLVLEGFGDTKPHEVKLFSVGKNEQASEPVIIHVTPLTPPVRTAFESIEFKPTFGGVEVSFENEAQENLVIEIMVDTDGFMRWERVQTFYTGALRGKFSVRGLDLSERRYGLYIRDRWNNKSDTLIQWMTPIYEETIPKSKWKIVKTLPGDTWQEASGLFIERVIDGKLGDGSTGDYSGTFASSNASVLPQWFTIDLGEQVTLSRIRMHQMPGSHMYNGSAVKKFEVYGSNSPDTDGGWTNWALLGQFDSFKPSGLATGYTEEDKHYAWFLGEEFVFDELLPPYRYLRFKTLETYASAGQVVITEIDLFGKVQP